MCNSREINNIAKYDKSVNNGVSDGAIESLHFGEDGEDNGVSLVTLYKTSAIQSQCS